MTPIEMLELAKAIAGRYSRPSMRDDLAAIASLAMVEALSKGTSAATESHMFMVGNHAIGMALRSAKRQPVAFSIHHAVTELIEEWKRQPVQEEVTAVAEVRRIAAKALTPPQLDVVMSRAREETHRTIAIRRRWSVGKAVKLEQDGMAALVDAIEDD
jgi:hypothetical protein